MRRYSVLLLCLVFFLTLPAIYVTGVEIPSQTIFKNLGTDNQPIHTTNTTSVQKSTDNVATTELPTTADSKYPVVRYSNDVLPDKIKGFIDHIDFQVIDKKNTKAYSNGQTYVYWKLPADDASVKKSEDLAEYIMSRKEWIGDRSADSVAGELYLHWIADSARPLFTKNPVNEALYNQLFIGTGDKRPSTISPTHLGYFYSSLKGTGNTPSDMMNQLLLTL